MMMLFRFVAFLIKIKTANNHTINPKLLLMNGNEGGKYASLASIMNPADTYWLHIKLMMVPYQNPLTGLV
jgi:hypothetical protein